MNVELRDWRIKAIPGMNTKLEPEELQTNFVTKAQNGRFEQEVGTFVKRQPISYFNGTKMDDQPVVGLYRLYTSGGVTKFISVCGTSAYVGNDSTGVMTAIRTSLTDGKRTSFLTYNDLLIASNGYDNPWVYDGSSDNVTWELGSCKAVIAADGSNLDSAATYSYKITWDTDAIVNGAVSNTVTTDAAHRKVTLSNIPLGPVGCENRKIYRTEGGGTAYYLIDTIADNTTTTYTDDKVDTTATPYPSVTDDIPLGNILKVFRERLFIAGDPSNPNTIYYSYPYLPHILLQTTGPDTLEVSPDDNDEIVGLPVYMGMMLCIKKNNTRKMYVQGPDSSWYAEDPMLYIGSPAPWSIIETAEGIVWLGWDHWYLFNGNIQPIIDEFDTAEILTSRYSETVSFYHEDHLLAAYTDATIASQYHNRIMRWNFKRQKLSYDTINANCFTAKRGDDETGGLYYGSSTSTGFIYKAANEELNYKLYTKTQCSAGTSSDVFIGGTEASPYIEIGSTTAATAIPDDICILWDSDDTSPGSGWTEISSTALVKLSTTAGTSDAGTSHLHTLAVTCLESNGDHQGLEHSQQSYWHWSHTHDFSGNSDSETPYPRYITYRIFYKNNTTTEYEFPTGAIVMYDQVSAPDGWEMVSHNGYYLRLGTSSLGIETASSHPHTFSVTKTETDIQGTSSGNGAGNWATNSNTSGTWHGHTISGTTNSTDMSTWELDYASFMFIKKIGESSTWDGNSYYAYALYRSSGTPTGWTEVTTYNGMFLKFGSSITTGSAANAAHTQVLAAGTTSANAGGGGDVHGSALELAMYKHTHNYDEFSSGSTSAGDPPSLTFRLFKKVLGKMKDYNASIESSALTSGTWTSPSMQLNATELGKLWWNEDIEGTDNAVLYFRSGATQSTCEAAAWGSALTDPNGATGFATANVWIQYKVYFTATDTTSSNPRVYFADGFVVKFGYSQLATEAETAVEFIYEIGYRNFDLPMIDKIFKKIQTEHDETQGSFKVQWQTENSNNEFTVSLTDNPKRWASFFQDTAMGKEINLTVYKNDLYDFKLKELSGFYTPTPLLI